MTGMAPQQTDGDLKALTSALDHARGMTNQSSELRTKNFNFFVIIAAALVAGYTRPSPSWGWMVVFDLAGIFTSVLFFCLDIRGYGLHQRSVDQLTVLEPLVWDRAGILGWKPIPRHGGIRFLSHRWLYRTFFAVVGVSWALALVLNLLKR